jgi:hypothetical protein
VRGLLTTLKKIFFWNYARNTWQWDVLCVVIRIFIFLTPKSWLGKNGERAGPSTHQNSTTATLILSPEVVANEVDNGQLAQRIKALTGRPDVEIIAVRKVVDQEGRTLRLEVDIR